MRIRHVLLLSISLCFALFHSGCSDKESEPGLNADPSCKLVELNDGGYVLSLSYDGSGSLTEATSNFDEEFLTNYDGFGRLKQVLGSANIWIEHEEGGLPERIEFFNDQELLYHYTLQEENGLLTQWQSFPKGATEADRTVKLTYKGDAMDRIELYLFDENTSTQQLVMEADSIQTDGKVNPFSAEMLLFVLFMEDKPFAFGRENITAARIQVLGQDIPFSTEYTYNELDLLTSSTVNVQLFGGQTTFTYDCN